MAYNGLDMLHKVIKVNKGKLGFKMSELVQVATSVVVYRRHLPSLNLRTSASTQGPAGILRLVIGFGYLIPDSTSPGA